MKEIYYHKRDDEGKPRVTICLLKDEQTNEIIAKGISICSFCDNPHKENGRERAKKRAYACLFAERNLFPIKRVEALVVTDCCLCDEDRDLSFKGLYKPSLNEKERFISDKFKNKLVDSSN